MILEITVRTNHGYCGACAKSRGFRRRLTHLGWILRGLAMLPCLPFLLIYMEGLRVVRPPRVRLVRGNSPAKRRDPAILA